MSSEASGLLSMEHLFREAMLLHRNTVKELTNAKERIEQLLQAKKSLLDKTKSIQQRYSNLKKENKELQDAKEKADAARLPSDQGCRTCSYLQGSMDSLKEAYSRTLEEKDRAIKMLEERLAEVSKWDHSRNSHKKMLGHGKSPDTTSWKCMRVSGDLKKGTSPDSTNDRGLKYSQNKREKVGEINTDRTPINDTKTSQPSRLDDHSPGVKSDQLNSGSMKDKDVSPMTRKRLLTLAKENKKNRYQEALTLEEKTNMEQRNGYSMCNSQKPSKTHSESTENHPNVRSKDHNSNKLMSETNRVPGKRQRVSDGDGSFIAESDYEDGDVKRTRKLRKRDQLCPDIVVPETMAVDYFVDSDEESSNSDLENEIPVKDVNCTPPGGFRTPTRISQRGDNLNIGPPSASSTQIVRPSSRQSLAHNSGLLAENNQEMKQLKMTDKILSMIDPDITVLESPGKNNTVIENIPKDGSLSINTTAICVEEEGQLSPVFLGSKNVQKAVGSPCLFEEENKMAEEIDEEMSQKLLDVNLVQQLSSGQKSNLQEQNLLDDDDSQSPLLLHGTRSKQINQPISTKLTASRSNLAQSNRSVRRSTRGQKCTERDLKQTTLTQAFEDTFNKNSDIQVPQLDTMSSKVDKHASQFKMPQVETVRRKSAVKLETKTLQNNNYAILTVNNSTKRLSLGADLDETIAPEHTCDTIQGKVLPSLDHNVSLDPAVQLTLDFPDSMVTENLEQLKKIGKNMRSCGNESKNMEEESQMMPCSSKSVKFVGKVTTAMEDPEDALHKEDIDEGESDLDVEEENEEPVCPDVSLHSSFDRVPKVKGPDYAYVDVVRKKEERRKLNAFFCQECEDYFNSIELPQEERANRMQNCSRHRARYVPPSTPEHFWSIGFPDTPECEERGYITKVSPKGPSRFRRKKRLEKRFKTTSEEKKEDKETEVKADMESESDLNTSELIFDL